MESPLVIYACTQSCARALAIDPENQYTLLKHMKFFLNLDYLDLDFG